MRGLSWLCCIWLLILIVPVNAKEKKDAFEDIGKVTAMTTPASSPFAIAKWEMSYKETSKEVSQERGGSFFGGASVNTFQRPKGLENKFFLKNTDETRLLVGAEFYIIYLDAFGTYLNTVSFYNRRPLDPGGKSAK